MAFHSSFKKLHLKRTKLNNKEAKKIKKFKCELFCSNRKCRNKEEEIVYVDYDKKMALCKEVYNLKKGGKYIKYNKKSKKILEFIF